MSHSQRVKVKMHNQRVFRRCHIQCARLARMERANSLLAAAKSIGALAVGDNDSANLHAESSRLYGLASDAYGDPGAAYGKFNRYMFDTHGGTKHGVVSWR